MKTEISSFCTDYAKMLRLLTGPLQRAVTRMERDAKSEVLRNPLAGLKDVQHRLEALVDKLDGQKAYLLIFGPLKSGKSTLMNAISGAYVSEVTALPAYPALVYLGHGEKQEFTLTSYDGGKTTLQDGSALQSLMLERHQQLADRVREQESRGESFDPGIHAPDAIRRIDVRLPVTNLKEGSTVLVDTPGLYSRMKFGYDLMTRTFRNSAACAVFVVKTDNLFLEQVFNEFNELLELFSRIFLVVNIDSRKMDLQPDGSLRPSIEGENPERIIRAFESLSMSAPLRRALDEGRLKIYPIDLLRAASLYLRGVSKRSESGVVRQQSLAVDGSEAGNGATETSAMTADTTPQFEQFIDDLTEYLNSSDYLVEFVRDSLRQGGTLTSEIEGFADGEMLAPFRRQQMETTRSLRDIQAKLATVKELEGFDLRGAFKRVREELKRETSEREESWKERTVAEMYQALDRWMDTGESLGALATEHWNPIVRRNLAGALADVNAKTAQLLESGQGGADLPESTRRQLTDVGMGLEKLRASTAEVTKDVVGEPPVDLKIAGEQIPVRKTFMDLLLFRRQSAIRQGLFGAPEALDRMIPSKLKRKRLMPGGKTVLEEMAKEQVNQLFPKFFNENATRVTRDYIEPFCKRFSETLSGIKKGVAEPLSALEAQSTLNASIDEALADLRERAREVSGGIEGMVTRYTPPPPPPAPMLEEVSSDAESAPDSGDGNSAVGMTEDGQSTATPEGTEAATGESGETETPRPIRIEQN